jgi:STE24 endopeptidase
MILTPLESVVSIALNAVSRRFEWEADRFAVELPSKLAVQPSEKDLTEMADMGERLKRALIQLHVKNLSTVWVDWLYALPQSAAMDTSLTPTSLNRYSAYHHSHPTLTERLKALDAFQVKQAAIEKKDL